MPSSDVSEESSTNSGVIAPPAAKKAKRKKKDLPVELANITLKDKDRIVVESTTLDKDFADGDFVVGQQYDIAVGVKCTDSDVIYNLDELNLDQLRDLAKNLKVTSSSKMNKFQCRHAIAIVMQRFNVIDGPNPVTGPTVPLYNQMRYNTLVRLTNVIFSEEFIDAYMTSNDRRTRQDHEIGNGGKMERFWGDVQLALESQGNDDDDPFGVIDRFEDDPDDRIRQHIDNALEDPKNYSLNPAHILKTWTAKLMKVRSLVLKNFRLSG